MLKESGSCQSYFNVIECGSLSQTDMMWPSNYSDMKVLDALKPGERESGIRENENYARLNTTLCKNKSKRKHRPEQPRLG